MTSVIPFSLYRWGLKSRQSSVTFLYGYLKTSGTASFSSFEVKDIFNFLQDTDMCVFTMASLRQSPPLASPQESLVNPGALHFCFQKICQLSSSGNNETGHHVTDPSDSQEGPGVALPLPLAADIKPKQIPHNKTDDKTQRKGNVRGSEVVTETTLEPN